MKQNRADDNDVAKKFKRKLSDLRKLLKSFEDFKYPTFSRDRMQDDLFDLLFGPLELFHPASIICDDKLKKRGIGSWERLSKRLDENVEEEDGDQFSIEKEREYALGVPKDWIGEIQVVLLQRILIDWREFLEEEKLFAWVLQVWFIPIDHGEGEKGHGSGAIQSMGLRTISVFLTRYTLEEAKVMNFPALEMKPPSAHGLNDRTLHASTKEILVKLVSMLPARLSLASILHATSLIKDSPKRALVWDDMVRDVVAVPDRVANVTKGDVPKGLERTSWESYLALQIEQLMRFNKSDSESQQEIPSMIGTLLSKMIRTGSLSTSLSAFHPASKSRNFWQTFLPMAFRNASAVYVDGKVKLTTSFRRMWDMTLDILDGDDYTVLVNTLLGTLDTKSSLPSHLITFQEAGSPGSEGSQFLSTKTTQLIALLSDLIEVLCLPSETVQGSKEGRKERVGSDDEEDYNERDTISCWLDVALQGRVRGGSRLRYRSPLMGCALALALQRSSIRHKQSNVLSDCFAEVVAVWSSADRVKSGALEQEIYLSTLLLSLLVCQVDHPASVGPLKTSSTFITGVSAHLEHLSTTVRRMGMLVAEAVSAHSQNAGTSDKVLSFGRSMWDGRGEGREEARVLRALVDSWSSRFGQDGMKNVLSKPYCEVFFEEWDKMPPEEAKATSVIVKAPKHRQRAATRRLPVKKAAGSRNAGKGSLVQEVDSKDDGHDDLLEGGNSNAHLPSLTNVSGKQAAVADLDALNVSSSEASSSESDSDSSRSSEPGMSSMHSSHNRGERSFADLQIPENLKRGGSQKSNGDKEAFGMGVPPQKKRRPPIYIGELAPLLRENERDANRLGLKSVERLVRKKRGWGGEIDEHAVDLAHALCGMQNNFSLRNFDERRTGALTALVVASSHAVAPCIIEQYFGQQYSIVQRVSMLNALAFAARELASLRPLPHKARLTNATKGDDVDGLADSLASTAIARAKMHGEDRVPEISKEKQLLVNGQSRSTAFPSSLRHFVTPISPSSPSKWRGGTTSSQLPGAQSRPKDSYVDIGLVCFVFPLLNRFWAHMDEADRQTARTSNVGRMRAGMGSTTLFSPFLVASVLDTLSILTHAARHARGYSRQVVPLLLDFALSVASKSSLFSASNSIFSPSSSLFGKEEEEEEGALTVSGALASLVLVNLDAVWDLDQGKILCREHAALLHDVTEWAASVFYREEQGSSKAAAMGRAGRASAAILLRLNEMREV